MAARSAFRLVAPTSRSSLTAIHISCHVKPGVSKNSEGVMSVSDEVVQLRTSARAIDGQANRAVVEIISAVNDA